MLQPVAILSVFAYLTLCQGQTTLPAETAASIRVAAVIPTMAGQIGINPVDILPTESASVSIGVDTDYLTETVDGATTSTKWIGVDSAFGIATITKTASDGQTQATTIPNGFRVVMNVAGELEFTLSKLMQERIAAIRAEMPAELKQRRSLSGISPRSLHGRSPPVDTAGLSQRVGWMSGRLRGAPDIMEQMVNLDSQVIAVSGNDAAGLASSNRMMAFTNEETVTSILASTETEAVAAAAVSVGILGVFASVAFFVTYLEDWWKWRADPQPLPIYTPPKTTPDSCPSRRPACDGIGCQGDDDEKCTLNHKGCDCMTSAEETSDTFALDSWADIQHQIQIFIPGPDDVGGKVPSAECVESTKENIVDFEKPTFQLMIDNVCGQSPTLSNSISKSLKASDVGESGFENWSIEFKLDSTSDCSAYQCNDVFGQFLSCSKSSHTMVKSGNVKLDCGTASFSVNPPTSNIKPGRSVCTTSVTDATPRMIQIVTDSYITEFCKNHFKSSDSTGIVMKGGPGSGFIPWMVLDKDDNWLDTIIPEFKATKDEKFCGPTEVFNKVSGNVSVDRCMENLRIALNSCGPFSQPEGAKYFTKYPSSIYQDCWQWEILALAA